MRREAGPWSLVAPLGRGATSVVWRARHRDTGAGAAVKVVSGSASAARREIRALARLDHPGIARILDAGTSDGSAWFALELVEGATLRDHLATPAAPTVDLERGAVGAVAAPAPAPDVLGAVGGLAATLAWLHGEGIVHRDVKPDNLVLRPDGSTVLVDFGLAADSAREELDLATRRQGTAPYAAPEILRGEEADARADLYALGCVLYEVLSGRPPFVGSARDVVRGHLAVAPAPLDGPLGALALRLLEKDPARRLDRAEDVARAIVGRAPVVRDWLYRAPLVGREAALGDLDTWGRGDAPLALVIGPRGSGRTRLAREVARRLAGHAIVSGRAEPGPLGGLRPVLRDLADRGRPVPEVGGEREARWRQILAGLDGDRPVLIALDDVHRADEETFGFLAWLVDRGAGRVRVLATAAAERASEALWHLASDARVCRVEIPPLPVEWTSIVAAALTGDPGLPVPRVGPALVRAALAVALDEGGLVRAPGGRWRLDGELPRSAAEIAARRLAVLSAEAADLAELLAAGAPLSEAEIGRLIPTGADDAVAALERAGLGDPVDGIAVGDLRAALLARLSPERAADLHRRLADALAASPEADPGRVGAHLAAAGRAAEAAPWLLRGVFHALDRHAVDEALRRMSAAEAAGADVASAHVAIAGWLQTMGRVRESFAEATAALARGLSADDEVQALRAIASACAALGRPEEGEAALRRAVAAAGDRFEPRAKVTIELATLWTGFGRRAEARALLAELVGDPRLSPRLLGVVELNLAMLLAEDGEHDGARAGYLRALALHRAVGNRAAEGITLGNLGNLSAHEGDHAASIAPYTEALAVHRALGNRRSEAVTLLNLAAAHGRLGHHAVAKSGFETAIQQMEALGLVRQCAAARAYRVRWCREAGEPLDRAAELARARAALESVHDRLHLALCACEEGHLAVERGDDARGYLAQAEQLAGDLPGRAQAWITELRAAAGGRESAE